VYLIFDTETNGLPKNYNAPITDTANWPRLIQLAWQLHDDMGGLIEHGNFLIRPDGFEIPWETQAKSHGISTELARQRGVYLTDALHQFNKVLEKAKFVVGQNLKFDVSVLGCEFFRCNIPNILSELPILDTCTETTANVCQIPNKGNTRYKLPTLSELHFHLFGEFFGEAHNATADVEATARCFFELIRREILSAEYLKQTSTYFEQFKKNNPLRIAPIGLKHINFKGESEKLLPKEEEPEELSPDQINKNRQRLSAVSFAHLHNHTQFTLLQSTTSISNLIKQASQYDMPAVSITDTGNMMAAFQFENAINKHNKTIRNERQEAEKKGLPFNKREIKAIIGCEFNICDDLRQRGYKDNGFQVVLLAKNLNGYRNLIKLASIAYTEGFYYVPRIDKHEILKYKDDLIVLTGGYLFGEIPKRIISVGQQNAEETLLWWKQHFQNDLYIELNRHGLPDDDTISKTLFKFARRHNIRMVATNNTFYLEQTDHQTQEVLVCVKESDLLDTTKKSHLRLTNDQYYFKSQQEMKNLFVDLPEAIESVQEIIDKCEMYSLSREVLLPNFAIPEEFRNPLDKEDGGKRGENSYLRHLTYLGAKERYGVIDDKIRERLDFELSTIEKTGYPGYFLIVQDFCQAAREMGVWVGPGRGSAAGSAVAYCIKITNVDPIKYDLLFERFLNPDRVSLPDIDIDFDDEGRARVINWVIEKYGSNQVAQIITYGTMAAKSAIKDTARVMNLPLNEANSLSKLVPDLVSLSKLFSTDNSHLSNIVKNNQQVEKAIELKNKALGQELQSAVVRQAVKVEGSIRNTGTHACGIIITPEDITNLVPVSLAKDSQMWCTQFDNNVVESAGLLKMDFLGLSTLTILKNALNNIYLRHNIHIDIDSIPLDDTKTYELFQRGETVGIFQFESDGMQKYMRDLQPTEFSDLIALNALYRPGPMDYIPSFIRRKNGQEEIVYDLPACEEYLQETYGITVYQEQVMLLSQKLANFTKGEADTLRKAMGKKQKNVLDNMKPLFIKNGSDNGHPIRTLEKIWKDWEAFASYAFNKSHATCYAWIGYQTAYLKANYPAEYMAAVLSNNMKDISKVAFFMEECKRMGVKVLGPNVNESLAVFTVNAEGHIRFGLEGIKGLGAVPAQTIIDERKKGTYSSIFNFARRTASISNKRVYEGLANSGAFDVFTDLHRAQYFATDTKNKTFIENLSKSISNVKKTENTGQMSLFGGENTEVDMPRLQIPQVEPWETMEQLRREKEVVGIYISGHPLDEYKHELQWFCNGKVDMLNNMDEHVNKEFTLGCVITEINIRTTMRGKTYAQITVEDYTHTARFFLWDITFAKFQHLLKVNEFVAIRGKIEIPPRNNKADFNVLSVELLNAMRDRKIRSIRLEIPARSIDKSLIAELNHLFLNNVGSCNVNFSIYDPESDIHVKMNSKNFKIQVNNKIITTLDEKKITYKIGG